MERFCKKTALGGQINHAQPSQIKRLLAFFRPAREPHIDQHLARDMGLDPATHARLTHRWPSQGPVHPRW